MSCRSSCRFRSGSGGCWCNGFQPVWPTRPGTRALAIVLVIAWLVIALGFLTIAERVAPDRFHKRLAEKLLKMQPETAAIYTLERPRYSLGFYSGILMRQFSKEEMERRDEYNKMNEILPFLRAEKRQGRPSLLFCRKRALKRLADKGFTQVAKDNDWVLIMPTDQPVPRVYKQRPVDKALPTSPTNSQ